MPIKVSLHVLGKRIEDIVEANSYEEAKEAALIRYPSAVILKIDPFIR